LKCIGIVVEKQAKLYLKSIVIARRLKTPLWWRYKYIVVPERQNSIVMEMQKHMKYLEDRK
jgi:hypothetical protein